MRKFGSSHSQINNVNLELVSTKYHFLRNLSLCGPNIKVKTMNHQFNKLETQVKK